MPAKAVPHTLDEITPSLLSSLLAARWPGIVASRVALDGEIHGTATKVRLRLTYAADNGAPSVMWLKTGMEPHSEEMGKVGIYALEPRVYQDVLPTLPIRAPASYGAAYDETTGEGVVLLEDLTESGATLHTPESTVGIDQVSAMLKMLATFHAQTMQPGWLAAREWIGPVCAEYDEPDSYFARVAAPEALARFLQQPRCADYPPRAFDIDAVRNALDRLAAWARTATPRCLLHGDAHIGNSYTDAQGRPGLLDWQVVRHGGWAFDVAYYLVSALPVEQRRRHETALLREYLEHLSAAGGPRLPLESALDDYRHCLVYGFVMWLSNASAFQPEAYNTIVSMRFARAMVDHGMI